MRMKESLKRILAASVAATCLVSMGACGAPASTPSSSPPATPSASGSTGSSTVATTPTGPRTKVTVWSNNRHDADYVNGKIAAYNTANPDNIEIEYIIHTDNYTNMITMAASSNQSPDLIGISAAASQFDLTSFADTIVQPLNKFVTEDFAKKTNLENIQYEGINVIGENIYWIPTGLRSGNRLIYNTELFKAAGGAEAPKSTTELLATAKKITEYGKGVQYGVVIPGLSGPFKRMLYPMAEVSGIQPYDYKNGKFDFNTYKPIIEVGRQLFTDGSLLPGSVSMKVDPTRVQFSEGNVGMCGNASQEVGVLTDQFPAKMEWAAAPLPSLDGTIKGALTTSPNGGWMMSASTKNPEATWKVIEFFSSDDFLIGYMEAGLTLPISPYMDEKVDKSKIGKMADFSLLSYESVYPKFPAVSPEGQPWEDALWALCQPEGGDIAKGLADLTHSYNTALDKEVKMGKVKRLVVADFDPLNPSKGTAVYKTE